MDLALEASDAAPAADAAPPKPLLRGAFHLVGAPVAFVAGVLLATSAPASRAAVASGVFTLSLFLLFAVSATYHLPTWGPRGRLWMRRLDHASIFVLIAGTYTPVCLLALEPAIGWRLLLVAWGAAGVGIVKSLFWVDAPKALTAVVAVAVGWSLVPYLAEVRAGLTGLEFALLGLGGVAYMLGALAYATKRPVLNPAVFGYHEVFHVMTLVAAALHFVSIASLVARS